ncbi:MAG: hypothetical protein E6K75_06870 [Candidatus Eisenbacteria bacterium]|uniref:Uncharacterized protein n=1 Tax=Eiseniibacteriota bacterium TaxID=2212470 RepID=A0A538T1D4_UNCEI|nr:MAG: hypothetical protein E6K75_06870 [Candidatus Eisenbacteria bacterium]
MTPLRLPRPSVSLAVKIAATTSLPILAVLVTALLAVNSRVAAQQNRTVTADLARAALSFEKQMARQGEDLKRIGTVVTRDPKFFAMFTLPKSDRGSEDYQQTLAGVARARASSARRSRGARPAGTSWRGGVRTGSPSSRSWWAGRSWAR